MAKILKLLAKAREWLMIVIRYLGVALNVVNRTEEELKNNKKRGK